MTLRLKISEEFLKYNVSALTATAADFAILIFLTEVFNIWYVASAFIGALSGGIISFLMERRWAFKSVDAAVSKQAVKYIFISICSIILNTLGLYLVVELSSIPYAYSKMMVAIAVGVGFNYFTHKYYIFK